MLIVQIIKSLILVWQFFEIAVIAHVGKTFAEGYYILEGTIIPS